jgi:hypothetical protein
MLLCCKLKDTPEKLLPLSTLSIVAGLILIGISLVWTRLSLFASLGQNRNDFLHGFTIGLGITLAIGGAVLYAIAKSRCARKS